LNLVWNGPIWTDLDGWHENELKGKTKWIEKGMNLNHIHIQLTPIDQIRDLLSIRTTVFKTIEYGKWQISDKISKHTLVHVEMRLSSLSQFSRVWTNSLPEIRKWNFEKNDSLSKVKVRIQVYVTRIIIHFEPLGDLNRHQ